MPVVKFAHGRRQIIIPVAVLPPTFANSLAFSRKRGLIDTGASTSGVRLTLAKELDLPRRGKAVITTPSGDHMALLHQFRLGFFPNDGATLPFVLEEDIIGISCSPGEQFDVLIGMDVLGSGDLIIDRGGGGSFSLG